MEKEVFGALSSLAIILLRKRELGCIQLWLALIMLWLACYRCSACLFQTILWAGLQSVMIILTHLNSTTTRNKLPS